nr:MAG TPA: hypothetical protein [Caudoviricetes sp.]
MRQHRGLYTKDFEVLIPVVFSARGRYNPRI